MAPALNLLMLLVMVLGTTIAITSSNWMTAWMGLELGTFAFVPLMISQKHTRSVEAAIKYFVVQSAGAALILYASVFKAWFDGAWEINPACNTVSAVLVLTALALKMGLAPLHSWLPDVLQGLSFHTGLILSTWQKIAPLALMTQVGQANISLTLSFGLISVFMGGMGGLNQVQTRKLLAYSSIANLGWMTIILPFSPNLTMATLVIYAFTTYWVFMNFHTYNAKTINSLTISIAQNYPALASTLLALFSLGGLPPLVGFVPKWFILQDLTTHHMALLALTTAMCSLLSLYFYLRLCYAMALTKPPAVLQRLTAWRLKPTPSHHQLLLATIVTTLALFLPSGPGLNGFLF